MARTYWYAYANDGGASPPYFETRDEAAEACEPGEKPRPVSSTVIDVDAAGGESRAQPETFGDLPDEAAAPQTRLEAQYARDVCPWCDEYDGEHVGRHASSAHPKRWRVFQEKRDE